MKTKRTKKEFFKKRKEKINKWKDRKKKAQRPTQKLSHKFSVFFLSPTALFCLFIAVLSVRCGPGWKKFFPTIFRCDTIFCSSSILLLFLVFLFLFVCCCGGDGWVCCFFFYFFLFGNFINHNPLREIRVPYLVKGKVQGF